MNIGIYKITCLISGHFYIGQSKQLRNRWESHKRSLLKQKHHNRFLQNVSNKYGLENLVFEILEYCDESILNEKEQDLLNLYVGTDLCVNIAKIAENPVSVLERTDEWKAKISRARKGKTMSKETKAKLSLARKAQIFPEGYQDAYFDSIRGKPRDPKISRKIALTLTGRKLSCTHVQSLIDSHPGKAILCTNLEGLQLEFASAREAAEYFKCTKGAISACIRKGTYTTRLTAKLYGWKFEHKEY